jgi:hypothetical protein
MIHVGVVAVDQHSLTSDCIGYLSRNCLNPGSIRIIVVDNVSKTPYMQDWTMQACYAGVEITTLRNEKNRGYYHPLSQIAQMATTADIVVLMHNDLFIYEPGWDVHLINAFIGNRRLGMLGVCGSNEIDDRGGRGGGTICNFAGRVGQLQEHTGKRVTGLHRAAILDSMFMAMRRPVVDSLNIDEHIAPCHFYDKIWPLMAINAGWEVGVLGLLVDHQGGLTTTGALFEQFCREWCLQEQIPFSDSAGLAVYLEAEKRFLAYARQTGKLPFKI